MKIRKLVAATDVKANELAEGSCTISAQEDYLGAIDCIQNAINMLAHTLSCNKEDVVAKESIANLAVILLDLKSAHQPAPSEEVVPSEEVTVEEEI